MKKSPLVVVRRYPPPAPLDLLTWEGKHWPPASSNPGTPAFEIEGSVVTHFPLKVRKSKGAGGGYLRTTTSGDFFMEFHGVVVKPTKIKNISTGATLTLAEFTTAVEGFILEVKGKHCSKCRKDVSGTSKFCTDCGGTLSIPSSELCIRTSNTIVIWAKDTIEGDLRSKGDTKQTEPLVSGSEITCMTSDSTLVASSFALKHVVKAKSAASPKLVNAIDGAWAQGAEAMENNASATKVQKPPPKIDKGDADYWSDGEGEGD